MNKNLYLLALLFITATCAHAQSLDVHFNGLGFLDNREYKAFVERSRTYSGARTALDFGLNADSLNHFRVGLNALHEFGAEPYYVKVNPVAYYSYENHHWLFNAGMFPREGLLSQVPRAILNDTLRYYRPNVEGLLARYTSSHGYETMYIDWLSRQTNTDREQFLFGLAGKYALEPYGSFYISHYFNMLHDAGPAIDIPGDHIRDNGAAQIRFGYNVKHTGLDSLSFETGGMLSLARTRGADGADFFRKPVGFVFSAYAGYHRLAVFEEFYAGQPQFVTFGDSYYQKKFYNRIDIIYTPFLFDRIKGQFIASFHFSPGQFNDNQEAFRITYDLGRKTLVRFKD